MDHIYGTVKCVVALVLPEWGGKLTVKIEVGDELYITYFEQWSLGITPQKGGPELCISREEVRTHFKQEWLPNNPL